MFYISDKKEQKIVDVICSPIDHKYKNPSKCRYNSAHQTTNPSHHLYFRTRRFYYFRFDFKFTASVHHWLKKWLYMYMDIMITLLQNTVTKQTRVHIYIHLHVPQYIEQFTMSLQYQARKMTKIKKMRGLSVDPIPNFPK